MGGTEEIALPGSIRSHSDVIQVDEAVRIVRSITHITGTETIPLDDADGRTLAELISCPADVPGFLRSHLNGFAVLSSDTLNASPDHPCILPLTGMVRKGRGDHCTHIMGEAIRIETGGVIPSGSDAVVREEDGEVQSDSLFLKKPARSGENIIARDEDFKKGEPVYPSGWILRPQDIGVLASIGKTLVTVRKKPVIGIISTGRELISPDSIPDPGEVREVNSYLVSVFCRRQGAIPLRYGIVRDDEDTLLSLMRKATTECDAVIITGGSARDQNDVTARVIKRFGEVFSEYISFSSRKKNYYRKNQLCSGYRAAWSSICNFYGSCTGGYPSHPGFERLSLSEDL